MAAADLAPATEEERELHHVQRGACVWHTQSGSVINRQSAGLTAMVKESPLDPPPMSVNTRSQYVWVTTGFRVTLPFGTGFRVTLPFGSTVGRAL